MANMVCPGTSSPEPRPITALESQLSWPKSQLANIQNLVRWTLTVWCFSLLVSPVLFSREELTKGTTLMTSPSVGVNYLV